MQNERDYYKEALAIIQTSSIQPEREHLIALYDHILLMQTGAQLTMELVARMKEVLAERRKLLEQI